MVITLEKFNKNINDSRELPLKYIHIFYLVVLSFRPVTHYVWVFAFSRFGIILHSEPNRRKSTMKSEKMNGTQL